MGSSSGLAGLKCLQWLFRGIQFCCCVVVLGIYSYYIATMVNHSIDVSTGVRAVEGISAIGTLYTALGVLLVCCCAGHPAPSFISMVLDIGLAAAFIYVAVANRAGAGSCTSGTVDTVYGSGDAGATPGGGNDGITGVPGVTGGARLPTYQLACQMETACLVVACIAILFFILSIFLEVHLNRTRYRNSRPIRDADGEYINKSDHYGGAPPQRRDGRRGFLGLGGGGFRNHGAARGMPPAPVNPDMLPAHQQVGDMQTRQVEVPAWGEVSSLHDSDRLYFNDGASHNEHGPPVRMKSTTAPGPAAEEYREGDIGDREYNLYEEDKHGNDHSEMGHVSKHRETKNARLERLAAA